MRQFLIVIPRTQFNLYYRFGYTIVPRVFFVEFDGSFNDGTKRKIMSQFENLTPFDYDEEYLILHIEKVFRELEDFVRLEIQDLVAIFPLSEQAKGSMESKFDRRIRLENPIFENELALLEEDFLRQEVEGGISALWTICGFEISAEKYIKEIDIDNLLDAMQYRKHGTRSSLIQGRDYWVNLLAYDRYDYFPNSIIGFFYDAAQSFAFSRGDMSFEGSGLHGVLERINAQNPNARMRDIIRILESQEKTRSYIEKTTIGNIKQYEVAPLFLMLKHHIRESEDLSSTILIKRLQDLKEYNDSFCYAVVLLGTFFGFRKFYDLYYDNLNLKFFKELPKRVNYAESDLVQKEYTQLKDAADNCQVTSLPEPSRDSESHHVDEGSESNSNIYSNKQAEIDFNQSMENTVTETELKIDTPEYEEANENDGMPNVLPGEVSDKEGVVSDGNQIEEKITRILALNQNVSVDFLHNALKLNGEKKIKKGDLREVIKKMQNVQYDDLDKQSLLVLKVDSDTAGL